MKIFLTGATGVVGIRAIPLLLGAGHKITTVARSEAKAEELARAGTQPVQVNLFDHSEVIRAVAGHDAVMNLATHIPPSSRAMFRRAWYENDRIRKFASANLVDAAIAGGVSRFIQESFAPIHRDAAEEWIDESWPVQPVRYNLTVMDAERAARRMSGGAVILRFSFFYGPDPGGTTLDMIRFVRRGWVPLPISPDGFISSLSHDDAATAVVTALGIPAGIYNVTEDEPVRRREYFNLLAEVLGVTHPKFPPKWLGRLTGSIGEVLSRSLRISNRKLRSVSDWKPRYPSVREGWPALIRQIERPATSRHRPGS